MFLSFIFSHWDIRMVFMSKVRSQFIWAELSTYTSATVFMVTLIWYSSFNIADFSFHFGLYVQIQRKYIMWMLLFRYHWSSGEKHILQKINNSSTDRQVFSFQIEHIQVKKTILYLFCETIIATSRDGLVRLMMYLNGRTTCILLLLSVQWILLHHNYLTIYWWLVMWNKRRVKALIVKQQLVHLSHARMVKTTPQ